MVEPLLPLHMLADRPVNGLFETHRSDPSLGRRMRTFAGLVRGKYSGRTILLGTETFIEQKEDSNEPLLTYGSLLDLIQTDPKLTDIREALTSIPLRVNSPYVNLLHTEIPEQLLVWNSNPEVPLALQDLAFTIIHDVTLACAAFDDPDIYYPGVDDGIPPVSDEHVRLVMWGMQRELNRELRQRVGGYGTLPAAPLAKLPWHIQRALAERRRLRFLEWGITRREWLNNRWSLWDVPEDLDYKPSWQGD